MQSLSYPDVLQWWILALDPWGRITVDHIENWFVPIALSTQNKVVIIDIIIIISPSLIRVQAINQWFYQKVDGSKVDLTLSTR